MTETGLQLRPVLPPSIQQQLGLRDPRFRPLSDVKTVLRDLGEFDMDAEQVRQLVEQRVLIGFNIAVDDLGKCELRVLTRSIEFFRATGGKKYHELADDPRRNWEKIFRLVVPQARAREATAHVPAIITGLQIRRTLLCDRGHVENLILAGCLKSLKKSQPGPGGSWVVALASFEKFLEGRML